MAEARYANPNQQAGARVAPAHSVYGSPVASHRPTAGALDGTTRQVQSVMRAYEPPKRRKKDNPNIELCAAEGCKAFASESRGGLCLGHARQRGLLDLCAKKDCKAIPKKGEEFCHWHKPDPQVEVEAPITEAELFNDDPG